MAADQWYYVQAGQRLGPVLLETLRHLLAANAVLPSDLVWAEGMPDWVAAATIPALYTAPTQPAPSPAYGVPAYQPAGYGVPQAAQGYEQPNYGQPVGYYAAPQPTAQYGGFWLRFCATFIDGALISVVITIICVILGQLMKVSMPDVDAYISPEQYQFLGICEMIAIVLNWLYFASMESSSKQATLGKWAVGLKVTDLSGRRISFARASGRYFGKLISGMTFMIGFLMAAMTQKKQALHDMMASCLVVRR